MQAVTDSLLLQTYMSFINSHCFERQPMPATAESPSQVAVMWTHVLTLRPSLYVAVSAYLIQAI